MRSIAKGAAVLTTTTNLAAAEDRTVIKSKVGLDANSSGLAVYWEPTVVSIGTSIATAVGTILARLPRISGVLAQTTSFRSLLRMNCRCHGQAMNQARSRLRPRAPRPAICEIA